MTTAIWWIRRDLRLADNQALHRALQHAQVLPVFVLDPDVLGARAHAHAARRRAFLFAGLRSLDDALRARGARLIIREGRALPVLTRLREETGAAEIVAEEDVSPLARRRDQAIQAALPLTLTGGLTAHAVDAVCKADGRPYTVFTPFSKAWQTRAPVTASEILAAPQAIPFPARRSGLHGADLPRTPTVPGFPAGEEEADRRLHAFLQETVFDYASGRNRLDRSGTAILSPYFRFGMVSARRAVVAVRAVLEAAGDAAGLEGPRVWLSELIWREFYLHVLRHFPHVLGTEFNPALRRIPWRDAPADFEAWCRGQTGFPIVDACMRQLATTGWMHNRGRMIVASFLVKDLLIDWRRGEQWFMDQLVDGDPAANNGGWQWTAGVGTDAAPYFRIFNPVLQSEKFDPHGEFIRRYMPELAPVPDRYLHAPWSMPPLEQQACGVRIGTDYPAPIVDRAGARQRALAAYKQSQGR